MTRESALALVARLQFRPFSKADWMSFSGCNTDLAAQLLRHGLLAIANADRMSFSGCNTDNPLIAETDELLVIVDGNEIEIFPHDDENGSFKFSVGAI